MLNDNVAIEHQYLVPKDFTRTTLEYSSGVQMTSNQQLGMQTASINKL